MDAGNLQGLIPLCGGIYGLLMANGILPKNPKDPQKMELWRKKFGPALKILCPMVIGLGLLQLLGVI